MKQLFGASWKTSLLGLFTILNALSKFMIAMFDGDPTTNVAPADLMAQLTAGMGLMCARDNAVSTEEARGQSGNTGNPGGKLACWAFGLAAFCALCGCALAKVHPSP